MAVKNILSLIETPYIDAQNLLAFLGAYRRPRDWMQRMVKNGELIRLRNGCYLIAEKIRQGAIPYEQVANFLYGPSYVSLEWALSFYGMIPERVYTVTSMTLGKAKEYRTPIGDFAYFPLRTASYSIGIEQKKSSSSVGSFLIASREKALADFVFKTCKKLNQEQLRIELVESKRINLEIIRELDKPLLSEIARNYRSKVVCYLINLLGVL
ncbi:MAG: type IV toxin-antitoxin system AbiEi family antitoxin domain-containing protein [Nitrosotalea sp.]